MSYSTELANRWFSMLTEYGDEFNQQPQQAITEIIKLSNDNPNLYLESVNKLMILLVEQNCISVYFNLLNNGISDLMSNTKSSINLAIESGRVHFVIANKIRFIRTFDTVFNNYYIKAIADLNLEKIIKLTKVPNVELNFTVIAKELKRKKIEIFSEYMNDFDKDKYIADLTQLKNIASLLILKNFINISDLCIQQIAEIIYPYEELKHTINTKNIHFIRASIRAKAAMQFCQNYLLEYFANNKDLQNNGSFVKDAVAQFSLYFDFSMMDNLVNILIKFDSSLTATNSLYREYVSQKYSELNISL